MAELNPFKRAQRVQKKLRMTLIGPPGCGKTYSALRIATGLVPGGRIALIDTEHESATMYSKKFAFDTLQLPSFDPRTYIDYIRIAERFQYDVIIIDSFSHAWDGKGGALEIHSNISRQPGNNSYTAWNVVTPICNALTDAVLSSKAHCILTMRAEEDHIMEKDENGRTTVKSVGLAPIQRKRIKYEFDVVCDMDMNKNMHVSKSRIDIIDNQNYMKPGEDFGRLLADWLNDEDVSDRDIGATLDPDLSSSIQKLYGMIGYSPQQINDSLAKRGVSRISALAESQAKELIALLWNKAQSMAVAAPTPTPEPAPESLVDITPAALETAHAAMIHAADSFEITSAAERPDRAKNPD